MSTEMVAGIAIGSFAGLMVGYAIGKVMAIRDMTRKLRGKNGGL